MMINERMSATWRTTIESIAMPELSIWKRESNRSYLIFKVEAYVVEVDEGRK